MYSPSPLPPHKKPKKIEDKHILDLPDDCLIPIFRPLQVTDLLSVHKTCEKFQTPARHAFIASHTSLEIVQLDRDWFSIKTGSKTGCGHGDFGDVKKLLQIFGKCIRVLKIIRQCNDWTGDVRPVLQLLDTCCGEKLKSLALIEVSAYEIGDVSKVFRHLRNLELEDFRDSSTSSGVEKCLRLSENLMTFSITQYNSLPGSVLLRLNHQLEHISCNFMDNNLTEADLNHFLREHPNLKTIKFLPTFIPTVQCLSHLSNVETLYVNVESLTRADLHQIDWTGLFQLPNLQYLEVKLFRSVGESLATHAMQTSTPIITYICSLILNAFHFKDICDTLAAFQYERLQKLVIPFYGGLTTIGATMRPKLINAFASNLKNVKELHFLNFTRDFFNSFILEFVKIIDCLEMLFLTPAFLDTLGVEDILNLAAVQQAKGKELVVRYDESMRIKIEGILPTYRAEAPADLNVLKFQYFKNKIYEFRHLSF